MAYLFSDAVASYLSTLSATNIICSEIGTTLTLASNLFVEFEPDKECDIVSIFTFGGSPPNKDKRRQNPAIQIRVSASTPIRAAKIQQSIINQLHMNTISGKGLVKSVNSAPLMIGTIQGGQKYLSTSNYEIKHAR